MNCSRLFRWTNVAMAMAAVLLPTVSPALEPAAGLLPTAGVMDVSLQRDGSLHGQMMSDSGPAEPGTRVYLTQNNRVLMAADTQSSGQFAFGEVRPGVYELRAGRSTLPLRVWAAQAAPPAARPTILVVDGPLVVRGQQWSPVQRALILGGVIVTSGVIGGVIGYNVKDDAS